jgi:hypothetical protein
MAFHLLDVMLVLMRVCTLVSVGNVPSKATLHLVEHHLSHGMIVSVFTMTGKQLSIHVESSADRLVALRKLKLLDKSVSQGNLTPTLADLFRKFPASFPSGYSLQDSI